jgi:hypothetical protein
MMTKKVDRMDPVKLHELTWDDRTTPSHTRSPGIGMTRR